MSKKSTISRHGFKNFDISSTGKTIVVSMLVLVSLLILGLLFANVFGTEGELITLADNLVSLIFLSLFIFAYSKALDKKKFFRTSWWLLLGAAPIPYIATDSTLINVLLGLLLFGRFIVRLVVLIRISKLIIPRFYALQVITVLAFFMLLSTQLFYMAEHASNPEVQSHFDSFWWTMVTTTTVGYGDISPVTTGGRIIAIFMMLLGIGIVGLVTGSAASFLSKRIRNRYEEAHEKDT